MVTAASNAMLRRFAWGVAGGSLTGLQNFLKDSLTIIKSTRTNEQMPWALLVSFVLLAIATAFGGLLFLTSCMKRYDATYSSAAFVGSFVVSASFMSAVHYNTFQNLNSWESLLLYPAGLGVLVAGVYMLVKNSSPASETDEGIGINIVVDGDEFVQVNPTSPGSSSRGSRGEQSLIDLQHEHHRIGTVSQDSEPDLHVAFI